MVIQYIIASIVIHSSHNTSFYSPPITHKDFALHTILKLQKHSITYSLGEKTHVLQVKGLTGGLEAVPLKLKLRKTSKRKKKPKYQRLTTVTPTPPLLLVLMMSL